MDDDETSLSKLRTQVLYVVYHEKGRILRGYKQTKDKRVDVQCVFDEYVSEDDVCQERSETSRKGPGAVSARCVHRKWGRYGYDGIGRISTHIVS